MATLRVTNNENEAPIDAGNPRPVKVSGVCSFAPVSCG